MLVMIAPCKLTGGVDHPLPLSQPTAVAVLCLMWVGMWPLGPFYGHGRGRGAPLRPLGGGLGRDGRCSLCAQECAGAVNTVKRFSLRVYKRIRAVHSPRLRRPRAQRSVLSGVSAR